MTLAAGLALIASVHAGASIQLELHDAQGPTGAVATQTDIRRFAVVSPRGYSTVIDSGGVVDGYWSTDGYFQDAACTDGPYWEEGSAIPGTVFLYAQDSVGFVPHEAASLQLTTGQTVYYREFGGFCRSRELLTDGLYFRVLPNDPAVTGIKNAYPTPLRLKPARSRGGTCVFTNGFECRAAE